MNFISKKKIPRNRLTIFLFLIIIYVVNYINNQKFFSEFFLYITFISINFIFINNILLLFL